MESAPTLLLPEEPIISIRASRPLGRMFWRDLWAYRELLAFLVWRDLKIRYKQTFLGVIWALLQPLAATLIITFFFGRFGGFAKHADIPYPLYVYSGMLPWTFFANAVTNASNSLINNSNLITKVYFPRVLVPAAAVGAALADLAAGSILLLAMGFHYGHNVFWAQFLVPMLGLELACLALAVGLLMSSVAVRYRDARYLLPFLLQLWMFASPIIYLRSQVPKQWGWILDLNPIAGILGTFRTVTAGTPFPGAAFYWAGLTTMVLLILGVWNFRRMERIFADVI